MILVKVLAPLLVTTLKSEPVEGEVYMIGADYNYTVRPSEVCRFKATRMYPAKKPGYTAFDVFNPGGTTSKMLVKDGHYKTKEI